MRLSDESLRRFMHHYKEFYGEDLTINDARAMASRVALLYERLAQPLPDEDDITPLLQVDAPPSSLPNDECTESSPGTRDHPA